MSRANQSLVTASVDGVNLGVFEERDGGEQDSQETLYRLGGMGPRVSLGGNVEVDNVTIRRLFDIQALSQSKFLLARVGKGVMRISKQPLDADGNAVGEPFVWSGTLKRVAIPEDSADDDAAAQIEIEATISGRIA